jgi:hypothetical protein
MKIQRVWVNKDISLESLAQHVESFFKSKGFLTKRKTQGEQYLIIATGRHEDGSYVKMDTQIFKKKNELFLELSAGERDILSKMGSLTDLLFGGYITLQRIKSEEAVNKLESEFFNYIDQAVLTFTQPKI